MRVLDDPVANPRESPAAPEASTVPNISGCLAFTVWFAGCRMGGGLVEQSRRKTEMEDPALSPGCCSTRRTEKEGAAGDIVWGTERPGQSCLVAGLPDVRKKDNKQC